MYGNVAGEFLPDETPDFIYPGAELDYVHNCRRFNATDELLERGIEDGGWGDRVAIASDATDETVGYVDLRSAVERFASVLTDLGVGPGDRVLWRLGERPEAHVVQLATWKVGAINVPCPMAERAREIAFFLNDTEAVAVVASASGLDEVERAVSDAPSVEEVVVVGGNDGSHRSYAATLRDAEPRDGYADTAPTDAASVLYTGGTTGTPKGCLHSHAAEVACADADGGQAFDLGPDDVVLTHAPIGHAFGNLLKVALPLRFGASLVLLDRPSPDEMLDAVEREGVTVLWMIETMARMMLDDCDLAGADTGSLRVTMINEGTSATYDRWEDLVGVRPGNAFGMTPLRGHPLSSYRGGEKVAPGTSLGKPYRGYEVRVVSIEDPTEELGREEPGRLAVRGPTGITYWCNRHPELPGLMETDTHAGWSLLDDVFVRDDDGFLHFRSRMDDMINSAGRLISPVDVESVLREHGRVHDAAVVGVPHETRGEVVKAHVVPDGPVSDEAALTASLQAFVKERTAPYKYPREVEVVDRIPRDEVGKVRRRTLREGERD